MSAMLVVQVSFRLHSGVHVTGEQAKLWTDKALVVDWNEGRYPIVPATSLKGWLRASAERALRSLGIYTCDASSPVTICGLCPLCAVFGHPRGRSPLRFQDVRLAEARRDVRTSVSLSRYRRTAYEERLFSTEVAWSPRLESTVKGFFDTGIEAQQAAALLWLGARTGFALGAARSRGLGWLTLEHFSAAVDRQPVALTELSTILTAFVAQQRRVGQ